VLFCDLNHRLASSEASVGRNIALRESTPSNGGLLFRLDEDFQVGLAVRIVADLGKKERIRASTAIQRG
jgi:hypothetical protein